MRERVRGIRIALFFYCFLSEVCVLYAAILRVGNPLRWIQSKPHLQSVRLAGVRQFISHYQRCQSLELPHFYWGDEIEYGVFTRNTSNRHFDLSLSSTKIREFLSKQEKQYSDLPIGCEWQPEYGAWMVEAVPKNPYGSYVSDLCNVEKSMQLRRKRLHQALQPDEIAPTISSFPMLGVDGYEHCEPREGEIANSRYISDRIINPHPRFGALTRNIRMRRGSNVNILVPKDTSLSSLTELSEKREVGGEGEGKEKNIHMDAMAFGMGCCCLQVTMQCRSEVESRYLNDQLAILAPILQALSASTPIFRGQLADTDTRWNVIGGAVDDRTPAERGEITDPVKIKEAEQEELVGKGVRRLSKSRYSTISLFIGKPSSEEELKNIQALNDLPIDFNPEVLTMMSQSGVDDVLSLHIAHLFTRDPLVIFDDAIDLNDSQTLDHFENIQSTNWRSMRWKLPSLRIGKEYEKRREEKIASLITLRRENGGEDEIDFDHNILFEDRFDCIQDNSNSNNNNSNNIQSESPSETLVDDPALLSLPSFPISSSSASSELSELQSFGPGWRIEFRPLEVQLTDYENAAFAIFTVLLSRCIASQGHNFYLPMSYVEENMRRAQVKDAVRTERFFIRRNSIKSSTLPPSAASEALKTTPCASSISESDCECIECPPPASMIPAIPTVPSRKYDIPSLREIDIAELTMDEIFNGEKDLNRLDRFKGFIPMLLEYINSLGCDDRLYVTKELLPYFTLLSDKAKADLPTTAQWMREKILHPPSPLSETPLFTKEGVLNPQRVDYLLRLCEDIGMGRIQCPELYGYRQSTPVKEMKKILSDPMTNHLSLLNMTMIANLDKIDEEDLMFTNFSCFIKPVSFQSTSTISLHKRDGVEQEDRILLDDVRGSRGALDSRNISIMSLSVEESEVEDSKSVVKEDEVREERERRSSSPSPFRRIRNFVSNLFERKKRNREESIRF